MIAAFEQAQKTFKFFWRELSWEYRRIVPALEVACVKVAFSQEESGQGDPIVEHMWINDVDFDGDTITGVLINTPNELTNIENGDEIVVPVAQISDWLFATRGKTYGGFTIQAMRSDMTETERVDHDETWGLEFCDHNEVLLVYEQKEHPENVNEHPMSKNMKESLLDFLKQYPNELTAADEKGLTLLHRETIAGNRTSVEVLLAEGANKNATTRGGKTAFDFARQLGWEHIISILES